MKRTLWSRAAGPLVALAVVGAACGGSADTPSAQQPTAAPTTSMGAATTRPATTNAPSTNATATPAAGLRAGLTALLQEHVYLAGTTTFVALSGGDFTVPAATLDKNSVELAGAVGSVYGDAAGKQFLELWRKHIGFFVDYTNGAATGDVAKQTEAKSDLDGYRADFGAFLASANPNLTKDAVANELTPHVASVFAVIDAQAAKQPFFDLAKTAAGHMSHTAEVLSGAIATQFPEKFAA